MEALKGLIIAFVVISLWKLIRVKFLRKTTSKLNLKFWIANNWMDYVIHMGISFLFFFFEHDALGVINPILERNELWVIPHPENKLFIFVMIPVFVSLILYPLLRKVLSNPIQEKVAPHIHDEFCEHNYIAESEESIPGGGIKPPVKD